MENHLAVPRTGRNPFLAVLYSMNQCIESEDEDLKPERESKLQKLMVDTHLKGSKPLCISVFNVCNDIDLEFSGEGQSFCIQ